MLFVNMRIYPITTTNTIANTNPTIAFKFLFFILLFFVVRTGIEPVKYGEFIRCTHTFNITTQASAIPPPDYVLIFIKIKT